MRAVMGLEQAALVVPEAPGQGRACPLISEDLISTISPVAPPVVRAAEEVCMTSFPTSLEVAEQQPPARSRSRALISNTRSTSVSGTPFAARSCAWRSAARTLAQIAAAKVWWARRVPVHVAEAAAR